MTMVFKGSGVEGLVLDSGSYHGCEPHATLEGERFDSAPTLKQGRALPPLESH